MISGRQGQAVAMRRLIAVGLGLFSLGIGSVLAQQEVSVNPASRAPIATSQTLPTGDAVEPIALNSAAQPVRRADSSVRVVPLHKLIGHFSPITLPSSRSEYTIPLPVSARENIQNMVLDLRFSNSLSLLRDRSQLFVRLNGQNVAQFPLLPQTLQSHYEIPLPLELLKVGYNELTIGVVQHYTDLCEDPSAPELWTMIDTIRSTLSVSSELITLNPRLSDLETLLDAKQWHQHSVAIVTPTPAITPAQLNIGAQVAQGAALRLDYQPVPFRHLTLAQVADRAATHGIRVSSAAVAGSDLVVMGTKDQLRAILPPDIYTQIQESFLGIYPIPNNPKRFVLIVSGSTDEGVLRAAKAFSFLSFPFPDKPSATIANIELPEWHQYSNKNAITKPGRYLFSHFGYQTKTVKGMLTEQVGFDFHLPPDYFVNEDDFFEFRLRLAYGAAFRRDSVLNIYVNGLFQSAVLLDDERGGEYQDYRLKISGRSFKPGLNKVLFQPVMIPLVSDQCELLHSENLLLTLHDDSMLIAPSIQQLGRLPNLQLFARTIYPYAVPGDGADSYLFVADKDTTTIASAWSIVGKMAQRRGVPLTELTLGFDAPDASLKQDLVIVGSHQSIPSDLLKGSPFGFDKSPLEASYPTWITRTREDQQPSWYEEVVERLSLHTYRPVEDRLLDHAKIHQFDGIGDYLVTIQYQSPLASGRTVTAFFAENSQRLGIGVRNLIEPEVWDQLRGDVSLWKPGLEDVPWMKTNAEYSSSSSFGRTGIQYTFSRHPWLWFLVLLLCLILPFSILSRRLYRNYRARKDETIIETGNRRNEFSDDDHVVRATELSDDSTVVQPLRRPEDRE